ncbi:ALG6 alpha-1,3-glucosyltransferase garnysstan isoform X2 [Rhynchophorus ferrugineus]
MEVTTNLPIKEWYLNSTDNNLNYWGLDYPPLTAYHMYLCGKVAGFINENFTKLHDSRGYESLTHKLFMRYTVLFSDVMIFIPSIILYYYTCIKLGNGQDSDISSARQKSQHSLKLIIRDSSLLVISALLYPGIILIDHGHFQYNSISLGLFIFATISLLHKKDILTCLFFCLCLNYKQMELYHSLPFFLYLLSTCVPKPGQNALWGFLKLAKIGITVIIIFIIIWLPFLFDFNILLHVLKRQFPIARGVFEDKVSNMWCTLNIIYKFKSYFDNYQMMRICLFTTVCAVLPSCADLFLRPNSRKFVLAVINSSLAFFLFSFQVHEKSILLVAVPVLLYFPYSPFACFWFLFISIFSMVPLLIKDNLSVALISLTTFYIVTMKICIEHTLKNSWNMNRGLFEYYHKIFNILFNVDLKKKIILRKKVMLMYHRFSQNKEAVYALFFHIIMIFSLVGALVLFIVTLIFEPPRKYPDIFPLLISVYSCIHFLGFFVYFNIKQISIPQEFDDIRYVKVKMS